MYLTEAVVLVSLLLDLNSAEGTLVILLLNLKYILVVFIFAQGLEQKR